MSKIQNITETKVEVYKKMIDNFEKQLLDYKVEIDKQSHADEKTYPLIYNTLEKYFNIVKEANEGGKLDDKQLNEASQHLSRIKNLFIEHQSNLRRSVDIIKGKLEATQAHKKNLELLLQKEQKILKNILEGNIDENGMYIGDPARRPPGVRPADPNASRKQNK
jgi:hypothetical protein